ncbi:hypothetical protein Psta_1143 [Pirellula staleyi DSM 6068]|uniref:Helix-turn-helix domain-containing protein n=1 Tax=Pirellula staleyi (strain ATCC 27377 / DSM 6068 / ICPB 4128) TaxID=530564 RepID=D2R8Z8_PIRSD|nr:hypothetical protein Psta_1143 [Pirellula staleyi DSM 6068]
MTNSYQNDVKNERRYVTLREASELYPLSEMTFRRLASAGKITLYRPTPGKLFLSVDEIESHFRTSAGARGKKCPAS